MRVLDTYLLVASCSRGSLVSKPPLPFARTQSSPRHLLSPCFQHILALPLILLPHGEQQKTLFGHLSILSMKQYQGSFLLATSSAIHSRTWASLRISSILYVSTLETSFMKNNNYVLQIKTNLNNHSWIFSYIPNFCQIYCDRFMYTYSMYDKKLRHRESPEEIFETTKYWFRI